MLIQNENLKNYPSLPNSNNLLHLDKPLGDSFNFMQTQLDFTTKATSSSDNFKKCGKCKISKTITDFSLCSRKNDGLQVWCKQCTTKYKKEKASLLYLVSVPSLENEIWADIKGYEGLYQISNYERVKGLKRDGFVKSKNVQNHPIKEKILKGGVSSTGYKCFTACKNGIKKHVFYHRVLAECFVPNPDNLPQVNHIDGNKLNNNLSNIEWVTAQENMIHARVNGLHKGKSLSEDNVKEILLHINSKSDNEISKMYNVSSQTILLIRKNRTWKSIPR